MPGAVAGMFAPAQNLFGMGSAYGNEMMGLAQGIGGGLYGAGAAQQQQMQNQMNTQFQNQMRQYGLPFALLQQLGPAMTQAALGGGQTIATGPMGGFGK